VKDLDREVLARLAEHLLLLLLEDLPGAVMRVDDLVADLVVTDGLDGLDDRSRLDVRCLRNGGPPSVVRSALPAPATSGGSGRRG
jgi:hypothetical protein